MERVPHKSKMKKLKERKVFLEYIYHKARSITGMFRHFFYSISAFLFHKVESESQWLLPNLQNGAKTNGNNHRYRNQG